jgi:ActR/RegA family two-component response regulator
MKKGLEKSMENSSDKLPHILLSGDNARTTSILQRALIEDGFRVELAPSYNELLPLWQRQRHAVVLLEVSGLHAVETAVNNALRLKRHDPLLFIGYVADPALHTSGLAGDAIFLRSPELLANALREHFKNES